MSETLQKKYSDLLDKIYKMIEEKEKDRHDQFLNSSFENEFLKPVSQYNGIKVIFDNEIAQVIIKKLNEEVEKLEMFDKAEKKINFLKNFASILSSKKFISSREYGKIKNKHQQIKDKPEFKWNGNLPFLRMADDKDEFREEFFPKYAKKTEVDCEDINEVREAYKTFWIDAFKMNISKVLLVKIDQCISKFEDRNEVYDEELKSLIDTSLGNMIGKDEDEIKINGKLREFAESQFIGSNQQHSENLEKQYYYLLNILHKFSGLKIWKEDKMNLSMRVAKFGSNVSGFASKNTDLDLTILTNCYVSEKRLLQYLKQFLDAEFKDRQKRSFKVELISSARIPLIKVMLRENKIETHFDIIVNNILGVINSKFMSIYGSIKWIRQLGILIKLWGKHHLIINEQMFSSYSMNLLLLHFLMETNRINLIMDARNRSDDAPHFTYKRTVRDNIESFRVYYKFKTSVQDVTKLSRVNLCEILTEFFEYYGKNGRHWKTRVEDQIITVDGSKNKEYQPDYIFTMRDPFDEKHNPGRVKHPEKNKIQNYFTDAYEAMKTKKMEFIQELFY